MNSVVMLPSLRVDFETFIKLLLKGLNVYVFLLSSTFGWTGVYKRKFRLKNEFASCLVFDEDY